MVNSNVYDDNTRLVRKAMISDTLESDISHVEKELELHDVDVCYKLISDDFVMDKFFKDIVNWEEDEINFYLDGVEALVIEFQKKGFQFSDDQIVRIKKLINLDITNRKDFSEEELNNAFIFKKFFEIYTNDSLYNKYLKTKDMDSTINGISKREINKEMIKALKNFGISASKLSNVFEDRHWRFVVVTDRFHKRYLEEDININPELEKRIMENIPKNLSDELMAYNIYIELNKQVSLDSRFYITHQDGSDKYNEKLLSTSIDKTNENNLICRTWSDMYYYLIKKYTDIECYIRMKTSEGFGHRYVILLIDNGNTIAVDGTNVVHDNMLDTNFTDILRCKLGLPTVNFTAYKDYRLEKNTIDGKLNPKEVIEKIINISGTKEEIENMNNLIMNNGLDTKGKLKLFMDFIEKRKDIDSISMRSLFSNLIYLFFNGQEKVYMLDYYKELDDGQYEYINCLKYFDDDVKDYIYLLLDKELGFIETSLEEINNLLSNGDIKHIPRRGI